MAATTAEAMGEAPSHNLLTLDFGGGDDYDEYASAEEEDEETDEPEYNNHHGEEKESEEYIEYYEEKNNARSDYSCVHNDEEEKEEKDDIPPSHPMISSSSMAAAVAAAAAKRKERLDNGGTKRITVIHDEQEYRQQFVSVAHAAAEMGRLTHLPEEVVMAIVPSKDNTDTWSGPSGILTLATTRSYLTVIHEAAKAGNARKLPEHVAANFEEDDDPYSKISPRLQQLLELNKRTGTGQQKVDTYIRTMKEKEQEWTPKTLKYDLDCLELPKKKPPKFVKKQVEVIPAGPTACIHMMAAEKAWARRQRLDRPGAELKVSSGCRCPYCGDPNPFQTYAYREKQLQYRERGYESESSEDTPEPTPPPAPVVSQAKKYVPKGNQFKKSDNLPVWPPPKPNAKVSKAKEPEAPPEQVAADTGCSCVIL
jgi:hypothetical protein